MDKRDEFVAEYEKDFNLMANTRKIEMKLDKNIEILNEFKKKGITSLFLSRKNGNIFRENAITSQEKQELSKIAKQAYIDIKKAALYNINNPLEAEKWLNILAPYLNNYNLDLDYFIHFGIPDLENPLSNIIEELENKGYDELRTSVVTEDDKEHNKVVNAYNLIKNFNFKTANKKVIDQQLEMVKSYVSDKGTINLIQSIPDYQKVDEKLEKYNSMLINQGATNTILNILKENHYDKPKEGEEIRDREETEQVRDYGMTEEDLEHNYVVAMYKQIEAYGFLIEPLKEQLDQQEILLNKVMEMDEIKDYIDKMEERTNNSTFNGNELSEKDIDEITLPSKKITLPAFLERVINKFSKQEERQEVLSNDEKIIKQKLEDLSTMNYDVFAYQLRDFKNYINDYNKPLNLSDGTNIIEEILNKAQKLELTTKEANEIIKKNPKYNPTLIHYAKNQIEDLVEYGCFLTSYCNDVIKKNGINLDTFKQEKIDTQEENNNTDDLQLPAIKIDMKEFLESVIQPSNNIENSDEKSLKKVMEPIKESGNTPEISINNENIEGPKLSSEVRINMTELIQKLTQPGMTQTDEEDEIIQELWKINGSGDLEAIKEVTEKINKLSPTPSKEIIQKTWENSISNNNPQKENKPNATIENPEVTEEENHISHMSTAQILNELVQKNNEIIDKVGIQRGIRIVEIQDEIEKLTSELNIENNKDSTIDNGLTLIETMTKSDIKDNENLEEYIKNIKEQRTREFNESYSKYANLDNEFDAIAESVQQEFQDNFKKRREVRDEIRKSAKVDEERLAKEIECGKTYLNIRSLYEAHEKVMNSRNTNIKTTNDSEIVGVKFDSNLDHFDELQKLTSEVKALLDNIKENKDYYPEELANFNKMYELMEMGNNIYKNYFQAAKSYMEIMQLDANFKSNNVTTKDIIEQKIKKLQLEEQMLSFNPEITRKEIEELMKNGVSDEKVSVKLDELLNPIVVLNKQQENYLVEEINALEEKLANKENYIDDSKIELETEKRDNLNEIIAKTDEKIEALRKIQSDKELQTTLESLKGILLTQQSSYEEEKEILLQWNVEESESDLDTRNALEELFKESKENLNHISLEIKACDERIESLEKTNLNSEEINQEITRLEEEKNSLVTEVNNINQSLTNKNDLKFANKELILSDTEELNRKKQELENIRNNSLEKMKEEFILSYNDEKKLKSNQANEEKENSIPTLPGVLENGNILKSDGTVVDKSISPYYKDPEKEIFDSVMNPEKPSLPGVVDGEKLNSDWTIGEDQLSDEEVESITEPSESLMEKATNLFKKIGKNILNWVKENPKVVAIKNWIQEHKKIAAAVGIAVGITVVGGAVSIIRGLSNDAPDIDKIPVETPTGIETVTEDTVDNVTDTVTMVDQTIKEMDEEKEESTSFEENYKSANTQVMNEEIPLYTSADRALNGQEAVASVYKPSFENADSTRIYKLEDGNLVKVSYEEAQNIVENGGQVSVALENDGVGIGYVAIGGNDMVEENSVGMSK